MRKNVVIGFLGTNLDAGKRRRWRPSVQIAQHPDFPIDRFELIYSGRWLSLAEKIKTDIELASPKTEVLLNHIDIQDPWDFEEMYGAMYDFARDYGFDDEREDYYIHLTTGTHVGQICWFLLAEARHIPAKLVQTGPPRSEEDGPGTKQIVDLDLSKYNALQQRFDLVTREYNTLLKGGIETRNPAFNAMIDRMEVVTSNSDAPLLLIGPTGTGKSDLAKRLYELKLQRRRIKGRLVHVNCSTLKGERAMSTLFGHRRQAVPGAGADRRGLLQEADGGVLFLDEIDELGLDEQAMILHAIETGKYLPLGSDYEVTSRFHLIAGAGKNLAEMVANQRFRADLFARLNLWTFSLPALRDRSEDIAANIAFELERMEKLLGNRIAFNADAQAAYQKFATDPGTHWPGNFRDLSASIQRMCTLAPRGRITQAMVTTEIETLTTTWHNASRDPDMQILTQYLGENAANIDEFDRVQLAAVIRVCTQSASLSAAGRRLFAASRAAKTSRNDADRLRKYLEKFGLDWRTCQS
ncbi:RNA repair transcriptional activator RtcR [Parasulfitobacter algicola]|uniref:Sigma 54-interacting transcriptional regulator n=1 Tax=Parasulfitobacter algicola TaxID=2614809 RepID=A0ABX2ILJ7_9RHOB|nr:RNA repair transcriptional activator RtcR [Sulfitobacter algicola]NSX53748.1 sigma 54-interacting transcriptional regulator [Sulfitobacter algicola]